jgi:hypothetical protein
LHGMYQLEFYDIIIARKDFNFSSTLLSGIVGDAWAGSIKKIDVLSEKDVNKLGYTHGIFLDKSFFKRGLKNSLKKKYFDQHKEILNDPFTQVISVIRMKMILLSYLTSIPEYFGIPVWTPFLNFNVVTTMLRLPKKDREGREWQREFFESKNLDVENLNLKFSTINSFYQDSTKTYTFKPLQVQIFEKILNVNKLEKLNRKINNKDKFLEFFLTRMKMRSILRIFGVKKVGYLGRLSSYFILKAIEKSVKYER